MDITSVFQTDEGVLSTPSRSSSLTTKVPTQPCSRQVPGLVHRNTKKSVRFRRVGTLVVRQEFLHEVFIGGTLTPDSERGSRFDS